MTDLGNQPDKWQTTYTGIDDGDPVDGCPDGFEVFGPWEPTGTGPICTRVAHAAGPEDMETIIVWRRPLIRLSGDHGVEVPDVG